MGALLRLPPVEVREPFVEVIHGDGEVVTVIEVLSLANKLPGDGHEKYRQKQEELRAGGVSLVEIDLLRGETYMLFDISARNIRH